MLQVWRLSLRRIANSAAAKIDNALQLLARENLVEHAIFALESGALCFGRIGHTGGDDHRRFILLPAIHEGRGHQSTSNYHDVLPCSR
ncbi:hypothetical protein D3C81_1846110 [compost metagenome]